MNMIYSTKNIQEYKDLSQTDKMLCKKVVQILLVINKVKRSSAAIGQWFSEPNKVEDSEKLKKETILYVMHLSLMLIKEQSNHKERMKIFSDIFYENY